MSYQKSGFASSIPPVTKNIMIINVIMWVACIIMRNKGIDLMNMLGLHYIQSGDFKFYQIITYMFLHSIGISGHIDISHIFFNMFAVFMFGRTVEMIWGSKQFLIYYLITGIGAGLMQELVWFFTLNPYFYDFAVTVGASGAVFGILLAFGMMFPNAPLFIMFIPVPIKAKYMVIGYGLLELYLGVANYGGDNVAHFAHLGGMLFGIIILLYWKKKGKLYGGHTRQF